jgi:CheY-like chemotaxis protein
MTFRALIAEDEPLLALGLQHALAEAWPELDTSALALDGIAAVQQALALQPDVLFFDIRMPGQSGLEAAAELADAWPPDRPFPHWSSSPPTTSTRCRPSRPRRRTICSSPYSPKGCGARCKGCSSG